MNCKSFSLLIKQSLRRLKLAWVNHEVFIRGDFTVRGSSLVHGLVLHSLCVESAISSFGSLREISNQLGS